MLERARADAIRDHAGVARGARRPADGRAALRRGRSQPARGDAPESGLGEGQLPARTAARAHAARRTRAIGSSRSPSRCARRTRPRRACSCGCWTASHERPRAACVAGALLVAHAPAAPAARRPRRRDGCPGRSTASAPTQSVARDPGGDRASRRTKPALYVALGLAYWNRDDPARRSPPSSAPSRSGRASAEAHNWLGVALTEKADLPGAIAELRKAVALDPKYGRAYTNLGAALVRSGDYRGPSQVFRTALALEPNSLAAHMNLGMALRENGDVAAALPHLRRVAAADPKQRRRALRARPDAAPERRSRRRGRRVRDGAGHRSGAARGLLRARPAS